MDLLGAFFSELAAIIGYMLLSVAVYKLFQITTELGEIKELLKKQARSSVSALAPPEQDPISSPIADLHSSDDAAVYAEKLLRAVNAESHASMHAVPPASNENA